MYFQLLHTLCCVNRPSVECFPQTLQRIQLLMLFIKLNITSQNRFSQSASHCGSGYKNFLQHQTHTFICIEKKEQRVLLQKQTQFMVSTDDLGCTHIFMTPTKSLRKSFTNCLTVTQTLNVMSKKLPKGTKTNKLNTDHQNTFLTHIIRLLFLKCVH